MSSEFDEKVSAGGEGAGLVATLVEAPAFDQTMPLGDTHVERFVRDDADGLIRKRLAHFEVIGFVGGGGMGAVYRARDVALDRIVALKVLPEDFNKPVLVERFKREARAQARLSHPNVVPIYYIGEQDERHFFAMELVEGHSLDAILDEETVLKWPTAIEYMLDVCKALRQAHERGLIHRDLKPGNLLLTPEGLVKVADFGLARPIAKEDGALTQEGAFMGTPMYCSPEQARGQEVDHRTDMYALGATFFHLLSRRPVFSAPTAMALLLKHITEPAPRIEELGLDIPPGLAAIIARLLAKSPDDRFVDYDALIAALEAARPSKHVDAGTLVRAIACGVDVMLVMFTVVFWKNAPFIVYPLYFIGAWAWRGSTVGQWLFRIRTLREDGDALTLTDAFKRFGVTNWGAGVILLIGLVMYFGFGIESLHVGEHVVTSVRDLPAQVVGLLAVVAVCMVWLSVFFVGSFHPRKRCAQDLLTKTKVVYRLDE